MLKQNIQLTLLSPSLPGDAKSRGKKQKEKEDEEKEEQRESKDSYVKYFALLLKIDIEPTKGKKKKTNAVSVL